MKHTPWPLTALMIAAAVAEGQAPRLPDDVELRANVVYGKGGDKDLTLDLFLPKAAATVPRPGIVFMHGGAWRGGGPNQFHRHAIALAQKGWVAASIRYRLLPEGTFPTSVEDAKCSIRWMRAHADELHVDPDRICVGGGSAGGHLAAMVAYSDGFEGEGGNPAVSSKVVCLIGFNPVMDLAGLGEQDPNQKLCQNYLGVPFTGHEELWHSASPVDHIKAGAPPTLLMYGTEDPFVIGARKALAKLDELRVPNELFLAEGQKHAFFNQEPWLSRCIERMEAFLAAHVPAPER